MIEMTIARIAEIVGGELADITAEQAAQTRVTGTVEFDSRAVGPGGLFLALPGARSDGHDFAAGAVASGAVAVEVSATNRARASGLARDIMQSVWETAGSLSSRRRRDVPLREQNGKQAADLPGKRKPGDWPGFHRVAR